MITADRFLVRSTDRDEWLFHRSQGVTATMVAKAATPAGFRDVLAEIENPQDVVPNAFMLWGSEREHHIALYVKHEFDVLPNDWLICRDSGLNKWQMATPDGLDPVHHLTIGEYKTGGKPFEGVPKPHYRQMQWQMFVTGAESCVYAYEQRMGEPGNFFPHYEINTVLVERDEKEIKALVHVAEQLQQHLVYKSWDEMEELENEVNGA